MQPLEIDLWHMRRALELAARGEGYVEPNPMVGCVIARGAEIIGEGWHRRFGRDHAEIEALRMAGERAAGAALYVTLEPCCHQGKTPPCTRAIIESGIRRVIVAGLDPFPQVQGGGVAKLRNAGITVDVGLSRSEAQRLNAPYLKLIETGRPWIIAKWAMSLDGKIATHTGESRWISGDQSRRIVHELRGRVDAIVVGRGTVERDDPLLTARPPGPRTALRVVLDTNALLSEKSQLVCTIADAPVLAAVGRRSAEADRSRLARSGCEVFICEGDTYAARFDSLLAELGRRRLTNVLVEGGGRVLGSLLEAGAIDEIQAFIAPKLIGGANAPAPIAGKGIAALADALRLERPEIRQAGEDLHVRARVSHASPEK
ncbi:MAG: bifunctional diaminohydroxyphosphoribosylaminopyrimidine deaminase/5-amino-6-(5-phosphoribosylamino)uracil reductase RibD [Pirellulales bacterium]|nr:bifunctional diaminohydroxyphosphoribosylaminopyrimidine deaminase/5-amino-6-(5-phosphoribosylamino)uracil reductase RibD [Pirellulales bacterium]